jgi:prepilin-type N-terminal cleavage/methylation domain-containing protein
MMPRPLPTNRGFSLVELMLTVAIFGTLAAMAVPVMKDVTANLKLNEASRVVERELQAARLKAVSSNRELRVWTNCPGAGYVRTVEVLGTAADTASNRCLESAYPYPAPDTDLMTRPNFDGPVRALPNGATVGSSIIQFGPDGTAMNVVSGAAVTIVTPVTFTITRDGKSRLVTVNGVGKVQLQ